MDIDEGLERMTDGLAKLLKLEDDFKNVIGVVHQNIFINRFEAPNFRGTSITEVQVGRVTENVDMVWTMGAVIVDGPSGTEEANCRQ